MKKCSDDNENGDFAFNTASEASLANYSHCRNENGYPPTHRTLHPLERLQLHRRGYRHEVLLLPDRLDRRLALDYYLQFHRERAELVGRGCERDERREQR